MDRPRVGISRCLLGDQVRYDGGHKHEPLLAEALGAIVEWVPVCPEVEVGMGTPREPIRLMAAADGVTSGASRVRLLGVSSRRDWTMEMKMFAARRVRELAAAGLSGFVFKKDSPSCGVEAVPVHQAGDEAPLRTGRGLFAEAVVEGMPGLPVEDEDRLRDPAVRSTFLQRVLAYHEARSRG